MVYNLFDAAISPARIEQKGKYFNQYPTETNQKKPNKKTRYY